MISYCRVLIAAVNKEETPLQLHFFNNCFDNAFSNGQCMYNIRTYTHLWALELIVLCYITFMRNVADL